jgi:hypothetical protein
MKLIFTFTDSPDLSALSREDLYPTHFELPEAVLQLPDAKAQLLTFASLVGQLTRAALHFSCKELALKNHPVKLTVEKRHPNERLGHNFWDALICFHTFRNQNKLVSLKIRMPIESPLPPPHKSKHPKQLWSNLLRAQTQGHTEEQKKYLAAIQAIAEQGVTLLNSEPLPPGATPWQYEGFHPFWEDATAITLFNNRAKKRHDEERQHKKLAKKQEEREAKTAQAIAEGQEPQTTLKTGAGRRVGAVPGVFKGVQFRSQLEIRFVTQLEARQIRWIYEGERLGEGNYLVDFYLPDLKCWVEVKGRTEPRDDYFLKDIAAYLKRERSEKLFIYTSGKVFRVMAREFKPLSQAQFWAKLVE